jgi:hypothetical protein
MRRLILTIACLLGAGSLCLGGSGKAPAVAAALGQPQPNRFQLRG